MSTADDKRRLAWGYDPTTPTCGSCRNYCRARISSGKAQPPWCKAGRFSVNPGGSCDKWVDRKTGERLAP